MSWIMSHRQTKAPLVYHWYIGAVKIAEICYDSNATKWKWYVRLMRNDVAYDVEKKCFESMSAALKHLHELLNSPPEEETST